MTKIIKKQLGEKPSLMKIILFSLKAGSGAIGAAMVIEQSHPYIAAMVLAIGAISDQIINLHKWDDK